MERFANPFLKHRLLSISLNSLSKFKIRVLPSILSYYKKYRGVPQALCCALAALILFYRGRNPSGNEMEGRRAEEFYPIRDEEEILRRFAALWDRAAASGGAACRDAEFGSGSSGSAAPVYDLPVLAELVRAVLSFRDWWGEDLNAYAGLGEAVAENLALILRAGMGEALARAAGGDLEGSR